MSLHAIIQARLGSSRLNHKVMKIIEGLTLLEHIINRISHSNTITKIIIATTSLKEDIEIVNFCKNNNIDFYRGSENDVLDRYFETAKKFKSKNILRVTSDDPFKDFEIIDKMAELFFTKKYDLVTNTFPPTFPEGLDVEIFTFDALKFAKNNAKSDFEKEHVTQFFYKNSKNFKIKNFTNNINLSSNRWTIDTLDDLRFTERVYKDLYNKNHIFLMDDIINYLRLNPSVKEINANVKKSEMYR